MPLVAGMLVVATALDVRAQAGVPLPLRPSAIAFDSVGDVYFADSARHVVYEVTLAGTLRVVAGSGVQGYSGDGGPATSAALNAPHGLALGTDGAIFVADTGNARIRVVRAGVISTVAGTGVPGFSGDGGPATLAALNRPWGLALAANGDLYIADSANRRVRVLRAGLITTVAGNGVQGTAGDRGPAVSAPLSEPEGLAVSNDGRLLIADVGSSTVRLLSTAGVITTIAGQGSAGFSSDGSAATEAKLARPAGVAWGAKDEVYIADSGNHRVRVIAADGTITTAVGAGVQGGSEEGSAAANASLDGPEAVAVSPLGRIWFTDARNHSLRAVAADARVFQPSGLVMRTSTLNAQVSPVASGASTVSVRVSSQAGPAQGAASLYDGSTLLSTAPLADGQAVLTASLGSRPLTLQYGGDTLSPAVNAVVTSAGLQPNVLIATAQSATMRYGESLPPLAGSLEGVAPPDVGQVQAIFSTVAGATSPVGTYPIAATLSGPAASKYTVQLGPTSAQLTVTPQPTSAAMLTPAPAGYDGLPLSLTATLTSSVGQKPTGVVEFIEAGIVLAAAKLVNGSATAVVQAALGTHDVTARYVGDGNFLASQSTAQTIAVNTLPDFTLVQTSTAVPTLDSGTSATFTLQVGASPPPFTGAVAFSALGVPVGWTARFAPSNVIPGSTGATVTLTLTASQAEYRSRSGSGIMWALLLLPCICACSRSKRGSARFMLSAALLMIAGALSGCGDRVASIADIVAPQPASITVTGVGTNLAGKAVTHSVVVRYLKP